MDLSIIIVNWNVRDLLAACLRSIETYHGALKVEVIVVDSASSDGSVEMVQEQVPDVLLLAQTENVGFVKGNNIGLAKASGRYVMLLNPDTEVHPQALSAMVEYMDAHSEVGIVGPHTLNTDKTHQSTRRRFPTLLTGMVESTWLQSWFPDSILQKFYAADLPDEGTYEVDWVQGSALLARREVYEQIGGLDDRYIMFFEELDWCKQAKLKGWKVVYKGDSYVTHHGGQSTEQVGTRKHIHFQHSKLQYFRKFHGRLAAFLLRLVLIANYGIQILIEGAKGAVGHKPELRRERVLTYAAVLRSLLNKAKGG
ncbi:MAG: glycosyltransferase family 2 protein [Anaerolineae bacterium]|nr:glycosyltransferase family 2 protein [Anaerolineae bacterium]